MTIHNLGYPRIGDFRELKFTLEAYWKGEKTLEELETQAREIRYHNFQTQINAGIELIPVNDFAYYDQLLNMSTLLGVIPKRFRQADYDVEVAFRMARGRAPSDDQTCCAHHTPTTSKAGYAGAMKKWFDSNYHYIVPEMYDDTEFKITDTRLFDEVKEALALKQDVAHIDFKPVLIGPITYLYLAENVDNVIPKLNRLPALLEVYEQILHQLAELGIQWVQIDEPILGLELNPQWQQAFVDAYAILNASPVKILLATYFETLGENLTLACNLPLAGLHYDGIRGEKQLNALIEHYPANNVLSIGLIDGEISGKQI